MKKMFFTAIALVAFSATSMANTVEVKEVVIPVEEEVVVVVKRTACDSFWIASYELYLSQHPGSAGSPEAWGYADAISTVVGC